ncbi:MAG TPA: cytidine deaminase [Symbiobacteriaceae bacterium]|nr:cytidine deaminase [Symbiobacteriaceae bacterium]
MTEAELIAAAKAAREKAYVPYSHFPVGAALLTADGHLFTGCNVENASFGLTNCAERTAVFKMVSEGYQKITAIAIVGDTDGPVSPCGACRQVLSEFGSDATVYLTNLKGDVHRTTVGELLPGFFRSDDLPPA